MSAFNCQRYLIHLWWQKTTTFDPANELHVDFVEAFAMLTAKLWKIGDGTMDNSTGLGLGKSSSRRAKVVQVAALCESQADEGANAEGISQEDATKFQDGVSAADMKKAEEQKMDSGQFDELAERVCERVEAARAAGAALELCEDEFEKDDDSNFHIGFITAASNLRAMAYGIPGACARQPVVVCSDIVHCWLQLRHFSRQSLLLARSVTQQRACGDRSVCVADHPCNCYNHVNRFGIRVHRIDQNRDSVAQRKLQE